MITSIQLGSTLCAGVSAGSWESGELRQHLFWSLGALGCGWICFLYATSRALYGKKQTHRPSFNLLLILLILTRISWWGGPPSSSEDVWRYLWDGEQGRLGVEVYTIPPDRLELHQSPFKDSLVLPLLKPRVGHTTIPTIYPPGSQLIFRGVCWLNEQIGGGLIGALLLWRALLLCVEILLMLGLAKLSVQLALSKDALSLYVLCPLISFESALGAHLDVVAVTSLIWALTARNQRSWLNAGFYLGLGTTIKLIPILIMGFWLLELGRRLSTSLGQLVKLTAGFVSSICICSFLFWGELYQYHGVWPGLRAYGAHWAFNGSLHPLIEYLSLSLAEFLTFQDAETVKMLVKVGMGSALFGGVYMSLPLLDQRAEIDSLKARTWVTYYSYFLFFSLSPVIFSWYLIWLTPFVLVLLSDWERLKSHQKGLALGSVFWFILSGLTYVPRLRVLAGMTWYFHPILTLVEYGTLWVTFVLVTGYSNVRSRLRDF